MAIGSVVSVGSVGIGSLVDCGIDVCVVSVGVAILKVDGRVVNSG